MYHYFASNNAHIEWHWSVNRATILGHFICYC